MSILVKNINTLNWSLSIAQQGQIVQNLAAINQCIMIILSTVPGTDSLRPLFGCNLYSRMDNPINVAIPLMIKDIKDAITAYETRVTVNTITYSISGSTVTFTIYYTSNFGNSFVNLPVTIS